MSKIRQIIHRQGFYRVWLLAVILLLPYTIKSLHVCYCFDSSFKICCVERCGHDCCCDVDSCSECGEEEGHSSHNAADCFLCQFAFYTFLNSTEQWLVFTSFSYYLPEVWFIEDIYSYGVPTFYLRGPPIT